MPSDPQAKKGAAVMEVDFGDRLAARLSDNNEPSSSSASGGVKQPVLDAEPPRRRRVPIIAMSLGAVAVAGFVAIVWSAYQWGLEQGYSEEVPIFLAEEGPYKEKPENAGGMVIPNQDKQVLNDRGESPQTPQVERLLSAPEDPQPLPKPPEPAVESEPQTAEAQEPTPATPEIESAEVPALVPPKSPAASTRAGSDEVESPPAETTAKAELEAVAPSAGLTSAAPASPSSLAKTAGTSEAGGGSADFSNSGVAPSKTVQLAAVKQGDHVIQLASVTSAAAAEKEWARLQRTFPELLGDMALAVQVATVNGVEYHRVQTGPFPTRATALDMCAQLKAKKQACIVRRR